MKKKKILFGALIASAVLGVSSCKSDEQPTTIPDPTQSDVVEQRWTVTFNTNGGSSIMSIKVLDGNKLTVPTNPTKEGYTFKGWYTDSELTNEFNANTTVISNNIVLYAKWEADPVIEYTVTFVYDNGNDNTEVKVTENSKVTKPEAPTRDGYTFKGWYNGDNAYDFDTAVTANITLTAKWEEDVVTPPVDPVTKYTVTFVYGNGTDNTEVKVTENGKVTKPEDPTRDGYTFKGWYNGDNAYDFDAAVTANITLTAKWEEVSEITYEFDFKEFKELNSDRISDEDYKTTEDITYKCFTFASGMKTSETLFNTQGKLITVKASGEYNHLTYTGTVTKDNAYVKITKLVDGQEELVYRHDIEDKKFDITLDNLAEGTYNIRICIMKDENTEGTTAGKISKLSLTESSERKIYYSNVNIDLQDGSDVTTNKVETDTVFEKPSNPQREGYRFTGWYKDAACNEEYDFASKVSQDVTIYAGWIQTFTVIIKNGDTVLSEKVVDINSLISSPSIPTRDDLTFDCWIDQDGNKWDFATPVTKDITLSAKFIDKVIVTFNTNGGSEVESQRFDSNNKVTKPSNPTKENHRFVCWTTEDGIEFDFDQSITSSITLYAKWIEQFVVTVDADNGSEVLKYTLDNGSKVDKPATPSKEGYRFLGWYVNDTEYSFDSAITSSLAIKAKYVELVTVTFNSNGGSKVESQTIDINTKITKPEDPTRDHYNFLGWYIGDTVFDFNSEITSNTTLTAKWEDTEPEVENLIFHLI